MCVVKEALDLTMGHSKHASWPASCLRMGAWSLRFQGLHASIQKRAEADAARTAAEAAAAAERHKGQVRGLEVFLMSFPYILKQTLET